MVFGIDYIFSKIRLQILYFYINFHTTSNICKKKRDFFSKISISNSKYSTIIILINFNNITSVMHLFLIKKMYSSKFFGLNSVF